MSAVIVTMRMIMVVMIVLVSAMRVMAVVVMVMTVMMVMVVIVAMMMVVIMMVMMNRALRLKGARHGGVGRALAADQFFDRRMRGNIERLRASLHRHMFAAETPGETRQPGRILDADLKQLFFRRDDADKSAILQLQRVADFQRANAVQMNMQVQSFCGRHVAMMMFARLMIERDGVDDAFLLHGGFADDGMR